MILQDIVQQGGMEEELSLGNIVSVSKGISTRAGANEEKVIPIRTLEGNSVKVQTVIPYIAEGGTLVHSFTLAEEDGMNTIRNHKDLADIVFYTTAIYQAFSDYYFNLYYRPTEMRASWTSSAGSVVEDFAVSFSTLGDLYDISSGTAELLRTHYKNEISLYQYHPAKDVSFSNLNDDMSSTQALKMTSLEHSGIVTFGLNDTMYGSTSYYNDSYLLFGNECKRWDRHEKEEPESRELAAMRQPFGGTGSSGSGAASGAEYGSDGRAKRRFNSSTARHFTRG